MHRDLCRSILAFALAAIPAVAQITVNPPVVISHVYGGGGNSGATWRNDFVVLFNRSANAVAVSSWTIQYASSAGAGLLGATNQLAALTGSIAPGQYYLVQLASGGAAGTLLPTADASNGNVNMAAGAGKVALVNSTTGLGCNGSSGQPCNATQLGLIIDLVGYGTGTNFFEGAVTPSISATSWLVRAGNGCTDTNNNSADFTTTTSGTIPNSSSALSPCTALNGSGSASPSTVGAGNPTLITVSVTPGANPASTGITVSANLTSIGGSATQALFDNGSNGDATAGDNIFSFSATVNGATTSGSKSIAFSVADSQSRTATGSFNLTVTTPAPVVSINQIQGSGATSTFVGQTVQTSGIVTLRKSNGFYLQTPDAQIDADPNTSEGIFVFTSSAPPASAAAGNAVQVTGTVTEFRSSSQGSEDPNATTELTSPTVVLLTTGNALPTPATLTASSINPTLGFGQLERYEGMRVTFSSLTSTSPTDGNLSEANATSTSTGRFYAVPTGFARPFREPGIQIGTPLPLPGIPRWDGNLEIFEINFNMPGDTAIEVTSDTVITNMVGVLDYFSPYYVVNHEPGNVVGVSGLMSAVPVSGVSPNEIAVAGFNIERFYDTADDAGTSDVVLTQTAFNNRLKKVSLAIRNVLKFPDVISLEEVENLSTLQAIATQINTDAQTAGQPLPNYGSFLSEGNDVGGIDVGFLIKSNITVNSVTQLGATTTYTNPSTNQPEIVFDRPPLLADVTAKLASSDTGLNLKILANHLRSLNGNETQDASGNRIRVKRAAGAENVAGILQSLQSAAGANVLTLGDFNAFEFNDGYVDVMNTIKGLPTAAAQVQVASLDLVTPDFVNLMETRLTAGTNRYSYNFVGNAQVLDHVLVNSNLNSRVTRLEVARNDADFPETFRNDTTRAERISDHDIPVAYIALPNEVTSRTTVTRSGLAFNRVTQIYSGTISVTNTTGAAMSGPVYVFLKNLPSGVTVPNAAGTANGAPYVSSASSIAAGATISIPVQFRLTTPVTITYSTNVFAGSF